ncbi:hypothetical protein GKC30_03265 [Pseudodesulfovibrio sp. F-1]|uniref:Uncharacterized protein n=1 Tax=Pseudodesulfovibrio alkaliphilus TaxID=2661613 RepID=A0A7K1KKP3_9BACT|nr:hypothetical protein [Pseudodesulfovibrio alkaliphilus]MUM76649.1 hypothetical protein [Pseudodesulfovibrio alkaliphilus]
MSGKNATGLSRPTGMSTTTKRTLAKVGMATSLGLLVTTGLLETGKTETLKRLHLWSGFALVGFSYWHYSLYTRKPSGGA